MPTPPPKPIIFISYAHADEPEKPAEGEVRWLSFVTGHLRPAEEIGAFKIWTEPLAPDPDLDPEIERKLRACDMFVPLVSPHSLAFEAAVGSQIAIIRERQARGEGVTLYPLLLTPTPETVLDLVRGEGLRPLGGRPFSSYAAAERDRQMLDAADEIVEIAADAAALKKGRRLRSRAVSPIPPASPRRLADRWRGLKPEINDQESLGVWLKTQSPQVAAAIAARVALRLAPYWSHDAAKAGDTKGGSAFLAWKSAIFRASALARVSAKYPNRANELCAAAIVAAERAAAAHFYGELALGAAAYAVAYAAAVADAGALNSAFAAPVPFAAAAPFAASYATAAAAADPAVRMEIRFDAAALQRLGTGGLADLPLWWESPPDWWTNDWESLKAALPSDWDVWIEWYEERLRGGSSGEAYEFVFASVPPDVWDKGPAAANAWIREHLPKDPRGSSPPDFPPLSGPV